VFVFERRMERERDFWEDDMGPFLGVLGNVGIVGDCCGTNVEEKEKGDGVWGRVAGGGRGEWGKGGRG
jgi:hypothetical protein